MEDLIPKEFSLIFNVNFRKIQRYISIIKNVLFNFGFYNITIVYQRQYKVYRCYING